MVENKLPVDQTLVTTENKSIVLRGFRRTDDISRFLSKTFPSESHPGCIEIDASKNQKGYPKIRFGNKFEFAHRVAFRIYHGRLPNPETPQVLHKCNYPGCVNPCHLYEGTNAQNVQYKVECGRTAKGDGFTCSKLSEENVREIRKLYATGQYTYTELGYMYGVHHSTVGPIIRRTNWKHVV